MKRLSITTILSAAIGLFSLTGGGPASAEDPTCSSTLDIEVHGQHVVGDYVVGGGVEWPPSGGVVGEDVAGDGAAIPGGPGPGFHFEHGVAPGASFCLSQSQSPGAHPEP